MLFHARDLPSKRTVCSPCGLFFYLLLYFRVCLVDLVDVSLVQLLMRAERRGDVLLRVLEIVAHDRVDESDRVRECHGKVESQGVADEIEHVCRGRVVFFRASRICFGRKRNARGLQSSGARATAPNRKESDSFKSLSGENAVPQPRLITRTQCGDFSSLRVEACF